jgi:hypothetical protein
MGSLLAGSPGCTRDGFGGFLTRGVSRRRHQLAQHPGRGHGVAFHQFGDGGVLIATFSAGGGNVTVPSGAIVFTAGSCGVEAVVRRTLRRYVSHEYAQWTIM